MINAVITGSSKGIGKAIAEKILREGGNVALCSRNKSELETTARALQLINEDATVLFQNCDVSDKKQLESFARFINSKWDRLDILINNAGTFIPGSIQEEPDGTIEKTMETNVFSAYYLSRTLLPMMIKQKTGHIFNICSTASLKAYPNAGSYGISKFALLGFTRTLREELKTSNIRVTAVLPGPTFTSSWESAGIPESRFMKASDVAEMIFTAYSISGNAVVEDIVMRPMEGDI